MQNADRKPYLTKSSFVSAHVCEKRLWNSFHDPLPREETVPGSAAHIGIKIGRLAHDLFPDNSEEVTEKQNKKAVLRTLKLLENKTVPAIFEAAIEHNNVHVRVDILERLADGTWGIREVKSPGSIRENTKKEPLKLKYARDVAIQYAVLTAFGLEVSSVEIIHPNRSYARPACGIAAEGYFVREEVLPDIAGQESDTWAEVGKLLEVLAQPKPPTIDPSKSRCLTGDACPYWKDCSADKPDDWIDLLYRPKRGQLDRLKAAGKTTISVLASEEAENPEQARMIRVIRSGNPDIGEDLAQEIREISLPAIHLDFEYVSGWAWPLFEGEKPFEQLPFQFSAHRLNADGSCQHIGEYLAEGSINPRREFAEKLVALLSNGSEHIVAYNAKGAEIAVLEKLIAAFPEFANDLQKIKTRVVDLLPIVRGNFMNMNMINKKSLVGGGLFSLKNVAPALVDGFSYDNLGVVNQGGAAVEAFYQLATGELPADVTRKELRKSLRAYCKKDTEATALVHIKLIGSVRPNCLEPENGDS